MESVNSSRSKGRKLCIFEGCSNLNFARGLCSGHAAQIRRGKELTPLRGPKPKPEPGFLWCGSCKQAHPDERFGWDKVRNQPKRTCLDCCSKAQREYVKKNRERVNLTRRLRKHGISYDQFNSLMESQKGVCGICAQPGSLDIDHCHLDGHVRGLLCGPCNRALGFLKDDPAILRAAISYLEKNRVSPA